MSVDQDILTDDVPVQTAVDSPARRAPQRRPRDSRSGQRHTLRRLLRRGSGGRQVRLRKLRLLFILVFFAVLAFISAMFGMLTSVASDLPELANTAQFSRSVESYMYDDTGQPIGAIAPPAQQVVDQWKQINANMAHAVISVEDKRFWTDPGVDLKGIGRAFVSDVTGGPREGASTIAEQFVKNALTEENNRTILEKLREAALAFQLVHRWKRTQILTSYLNTIYFGHGAVGIESAARVYFGWAHGYDAAAPGNEPPGACGDPTAKDPRRPECADELTPAESAMLAGMVANPTEFDPTVHPEAAYGRRKVVLQDMLAQRYITQAQYVKANHTPLPKASEIQQPQEPAAAPYFTSWVRPQIVRALEREGVPYKVATYRAYYGGLKVHLTLNLKLQQAAQEAVNAEFPPSSSGPTASLVAIDNKTGEVRAMVSGNNDYAASPFNLATMGHRQPGSSFKVFTLAAALSRGEYGPDSVIDSAPQNIPFKLPRGATGHFIVHNFGNTYSGPITLSQATAESDNSVFAQVGMHVGTKHIRSFAKRMGIRSPVSTNPSMILGGLNTGVSALDMAHAYETLATGGVKVFNKTLGDVDGGPIGIHSILCPACSHHFIVNNHPQTQRELSPTVAATIKTMLEGVVGPGGTAPSAAIPGVVVAGKTGTTSNYVDAWFVGWTPQMTTAVWVGYPTKAVPMTTTYNGSPVEGGTYPALIWKNFMVQALQILASEHPGTITTSTTTAPAVVTPTVSTPSPAPVTPATTTPAAPATPTPATPTPATPATPPANTGGGTGGTGGGTGGGTNGGGTGGTGGGTGSGSGGAGTGGAAPGG